MKQASTTTVQPPHLLHPYSRPPSAAAQASLFADTWDRLTRSVASWSWVDQVVPVAADLQPRKIKEIAPAAFATFQQTLEDHGITRLPYCPRQYYNAQGDRYVLSRGYAFGTFGHVHIGVRSANDQHPQTRHVAVKAIPIEGAWRASSGPKVPNPHQRRDPSGHDVAPKKRATRLKTIEHEIALASQAGQAPIDTFVHNGRAYIVTDLMAGDAFEAVQRWAKHGCPQRRGDMALYVLDDISHSMATVHANGVVHCDLKLENVLFSVLGHLKVTDWGWATKLAPSASMLGMQAGTLGYIPLEALAGKTTDHRFDVFSLGVMVATAALCRRIFNATNMHRAALDVEAFEAWLAPLRDTTTGDIDPTKLRHTTGKWAQMAQDLIDILGTQVAVFVLGRMLTGDLGRRASMAEVAAFCDRSLQDETIDPHSAFRAMLACEALATTDTPRSELMHALIMFDQCFAPETSGASSTASPNRCI